jgi:hypothetical protein
MPPPRHAAAEALVIRQLLLDEAERLNIAATALVDDQGHPLSDDEARIEALLAAEVKTRAPMKPPRGAITTATVPVSAPCLWSRPNISCLLPTRPIRWPMVWPRGRKNRDPHSAG